MARHSLTELEAVIIGAVVSLPGRTRHSIRKIFHSSLSGHWSGSAGSVYLAVDRLVERGLLGDSASGTDALPSKALHATRSGRGQLLKWMHDADGVTLMPIDPLLLRAYFLGILSDTGQVEWLQFVEKQLLDNVKRMRLAMAQHEDDDQDEMVWRGTIAIAEAQLAWITGEIARLKSAKKRQRT